MTNVVGFCGVHCCLMWQPVASLPLDLPVCHMCQREERARVAEKAAAQRLFEASHPTVWERVVRMSLESGGGT